jgi:hypothetical protein
MQELFGGNFTCKVAIIQFERLKFVKGKDNCIADLLTGMGT